MIEEEFKVEVWGLFDLTKKQILIFQMVFLTLFISLTAFLFAYNFEQHVGNASFNFHAKYAKYFSLFATILIVIETQFLWSKFTQAQLDLIRTQKTEIEQQKEEILTQNERLLEHQEKILSSQKEIEAQNRDIMDSIKYASRIQSALLPSEKKMKRLLGDFFLFYKPRDIVSGDFYWLDEYMGKTVVAAADCTGHGVPGAFVSALGISMLNEVLQRAISTDEYINPSIILNRLRDRMLASISGTENTEETYDGMDISICIIDKKQNTLEYSGALQPIYILKRVSENPDKYELTAMKPDVHPISLTDFREHTYQNTIVNINKGDLIYMFSDGYADQFGGKKRKKFLTANFRKLLVSFAEKPVEQQNVILDKTLVDWQGELEQIDDIMVIGIRV